MSAVKLLLQVTGYLVFINIITGFGAIIPAMLIAPTTARHEAKKLMYHTTQVSCGLFSVMRSATATATVTARQYLLCMTWLKALALLL